MKFSDVSAEDVTEGCQPDFLPKLRSGGCADIGFRSNMEDVYVCVDNFRQGHGLNKHIDGPSAFYGVYLSLLSTYLDWSTDMIVVRMDFHFFLHDFLFFDILMCRHSLFLRFVFFHSHFLHI